MPLPPSIIIVMGVSGCGKTTVGSALAERLGCPFLEGDDFHPPENKAKMSSGIPLDDEDRVGWMNAIRTAMKKESDFTIVACSALRRRHRDYLSDFSRPVLFLHLVGGRSLLERRINSRTGHFFDPKLLDSQLEALEPPNEKERVVTIGIDANIENIVASALAHLRKCAVLPVSVTESP